MNVLRCFFQPEPARTRVILAALLACTVSWGWPEAPRADQDMENFDWVIYVQDTQMMKGPLKEPISIDLEAVNTSGHIEGEYTGSATMSFGTTLGDVSAQVVSTSTNLRFRLTPAQQAGSNAPGPSKQPEYAGQGEMTMVTVGTGTADGQSRSRSFTSTRPVAVAVNKTAVELVVTYPKGTVTYHGYIIGEGKGTHQAKVAKEKQEKAKRAKAQRPKPAAQKPQTEPPTEAPELAPLTPIPAEEPELAPLQPIKDEAPELAPLKPIQPEEPELAPLQPVTQEEIELAPLTPVK